MIVMHTTALDEYILACTPRGFPWDDWERYALASGLAAGLANLGRAVMREAYQHCWCERLKKECGWSDGGGPMLRRVRTQPRRTEARWEWLMATDGQRFDPWDYREHREDSFCWKALRAKWDREQAKPAAASVTSSLPAAVSTTFRLIPQTSSL